MRTSVSFVAVGATDVVIANGNGSSAAAGPERRKNFGGVKTDIRCRVLDKHFEPVAGLYAAGETMGLYYRSYTGATSVLKGLVFGRLAGMDAARSVRG